MDQTPSENQGEKKVSSYECIFCKKSFSSAQALGGHMNIHRKDKAKLKQSSKDQTTRKSLSINAACLDRVNVSGTATWPCIASSVDIKSPRGEGETATGQEFESAVLDLELRLGSQPPKSAATMNTRKLF
ncbi:unnamed protein product [Fraxinus pennsylvanica]|uniref:C2H2-type domain-containing protein n=1 Tax=Fraxinus pennsylvanica TaxID=56036 RepID=A0AAD1ZZK4_9LAMI|nr:unnamed protein product [Fraxinus pennsylvanica]